MSENKGGYRDSLNLPKTEFAMKANLVQREPLQKKAWAKEDIYSKIRQARSGSPKYILHDGPPYANGDIHMGHVINKVLKDIVIKYKTMAGFDAPYVPGWDCHGLPIEVKVMAELGEKARSMTKIEIRQLCKKYAAKYVKLQGQQFQELGVFGDFENPYLTLKPSYEAGICEVFAELVGKGLVYKQLKPVHWSIGCETALADAELEYKDLASTSAYVNFPVTQDSVKVLVSKGIISTQQATSAKLSFMIWTTTPWTLVANLAVAVNPLLEYTALEYTQDSQKFVSIIASERVGAVAAAAGLAEGTYSTGPLVKGRELEGMRYAHPLVENNPTEKDAYMVICADYVTIEDGSGLVHIAPGHGVEDYLAGQKYGLSVYSPVMDDGRYDATVPGWLAGKNVLEVDPVVVGKLKDIGVLFAAGKIVHSYPHCWRSKTPVVFRATEQWFIAVDKQIPAYGKTLRNLALSSTNTVNWVPAWGQKRISGMLESRPDWCVSRQRAWGMPIPAFYNSDGQTLLTKESVLAVGAHFRKKGSDSWFTDSPKEILGENFTLPAGFTFDDLQKEENIFDVWFESGCSWHSVIRQAGLQVPVDLYLEGSDQHRGWFQLSLLPALGATGAPPFKTVLTHGFTVDEKGMKQSKSLGNYVSALEEVHKHGADVLRLWVASVNYQEDMRCSDALISRLQESYRKIRNTLRYLFGNIDEFNPSADSVTYNDMLAIDKWAMQRLNKLIEEVRSAYDEFAFHRVYGLIYNFCAVDMSAIYMDVLKDRMYCDGAKSITRRSGQTAMYRILDAMIKMLAPVLAHTSEEAWAAMKFKSQDVTTVHLAAMPQPDPAIDHKTEEPKWAMLTDLRDEVLRALEGLRQSELIASNQEASVTVYSTDENLNAALEKLGLGAFAGLCIVSEVKLQKQAGPAKVVAQKSEHQKCQRCWNYWPTVGKLPATPDICTRCAEVVK